MIDPIVADAVARYLWKNARFASELVAENPILPLGKFQVEMDTERMKVGDGKTPYNSLPYMSFEKCEGNNE